MKWLLMLTIAVAAQAQDGTPLAEFEKRLETATTRYDTEAARALADDLHKQYETTRDRDTGYLLVRALVLVADLHRMEYELLPEDAGSKRRTLGNIIDDAATEALDVLEVMDNTSEVWRMRADLYGTMIRSDYRATRYQDRMQDAIDKALALNPENPRAHESAARPLVFADEEHGRNLEKAMAHIEKALALAPGLESARVLEAVVLEEMGRTNDAKAQWQAILEDNPHCVPAQRRLKALEAGGTSPKTQ